MRHFKKAIIILTVAIGCLLTTPKPPAQAAIPIALIIKEGVKKVIRAVDLMVQRLQNKTIALQNVQKVLENKLSELKLKDIANWTQKHRDLFAKYYEELWKVKNAIATYQRVRDVIAKQKRLVEECTRTWKVVREDKHFTTSEVAYMFKVYSGIMKESLKNIEQIKLVINAFTTQMSDSKRLEIIDEASRAINRNYVDLLEFNTQNFRLSLNRAKSQYEIDRLKRLYGLE